MGNRTLLGERLCGQCATSCAKGDGPDEDGDNCDEIIEDGAGCEPVGAIFEETLENAPPMDRELLRFAGGVNLVAVRWLLHMGANPFATDLNGTTALHTACRTGSLSIIQELVKLKGAKLDVVDCRGWTPLHIACTMSRRSVVMYLLRQKAPHEARTKEGLRPVELCRDATLHDAIIMLTRASYRSMDAPPSQLEAWEEDNVNNPVVHYEPFFVPRNPVITEMSDKGFLKQVGQAIFDAKPGQGLAFLVAAGCICDYPVDMSIFLRRAKLCKYQMGQFLGERFSLARMLRLEFVNSMKLLDLGIVATLEKVFSLLQLPPDMQKIDRLVGGVAMIWWRQHERSPDNAISPEDFVVSSPTTTSDETSELCGSSLKQYLPSPDVLHQLMFSAIMLHWHMYSSRDTSISILNKGDVKVQRVTMETWLAINHQLDCEGPALPQQIVEDVYRRVSKRFVPYFALGTVVPDPTRVVFNPRCMKLLHDVSTLEGWCSIDFSNEKSLARLTSQVANMFSETLSSAALEQQAKDLGQLVLPQATNGAYYARSRQRNLFRGSGLTIAAPVISASFSSHSRPAQEKAWLHLSGRLLLMSASPRNEEAPFAFMNLKTVGVEKGFETVTLVPAVGEQEASAPGVWGRGRGSSGGKITLVFLLPDGRWQEHDLPRLELQPMNEAGTEADHQLTEQWASKLQDAVAVANAPKGAALTNIGPGTPSSKKTTPASPPESGDRGDV